MPAEVGPVEVVLQYYCPNWRQASADREELASEIPDLAVSLRRVETPEAAERLSCRGSPSILDDGADPVGPDQAPVGLACRVHQTPDGPAGSPTRDQLGAVIAADT